MHFLSIATTADVFFDCATQSANTTPISISLVTVVTVQIFENFQHVVSTTVFLPPTK